MSKETLIPELDRLLDAGEPLLTLFPKQHPGKRWLQLPDNISPEMLWYANYVITRAWDLKQFQDFWHHCSKRILVDMVKDMEEGLLGWRAIGVLK